MSDARNLAPFRVPVRFTAQQARQGIVAQRTLRSEGGGSTLRGVRSS